MRFPSIQQVYTPSLGRWKSWNFVIYFSFGRRTALFKTLPFRFARQSKRLESDPFTIRSSLSFPLPPFLFLDFRHDTPTSDQTSPITYLCSRTQVALLNSGFPLSTGNTLRNLWMCTKPFDRLVEVGPIWLDENDIRF